MMRNLVRCSINFQTMKESSNEPIGYNRLPNSKKIVRAKLRNQQFKNKILLLAGDETDELGNTFLESLLRILCDFAIGWKSLLHDPADIRDRKVPVLLPDIGARAVVAALVTAATAGARRSISHSHRQSSTQIQTKTLEQPWKE